MCIWGIMPGPYGARSFEVVYAIYAGEAVHKLFGYGVPLLASQFVIRHRQRRCETIQQSGLTAMGSRKTGIGVIRPSV